jgi:hypothetical protein
MTKQEKESILNFIKLVRLEQDRRIAIKYATGAQLTALVGRVSQIAETVDDIDLSNFVEKETGKGLSTNDFTTAEKAILAQLKASDDSGFSEADFAAVFTD